MLVKLPNGEEAVSMGADTKANTLGPRALEVGDHCLFEDGSDRGGALYPKLVKTETAQGMGEVVAVRG